MAETMLSHAPDVPAAGDTEPLAGVEGCAAALAAGRVTAEDLVRRGLERISRFDGEDGLNAVITIAPDALEDARASDARRARGEALGPLDGVPFTVKDCIEAAGMPTTHGSATFAFWVPSQDAPVVAAARAAGMVLLAKVSLDDYAAACWGESSLQGTMRNPHDPTRMVGGSSGGSAVAVAAGYAPMSIGTDTGGSLRIPAALCGVATLRPTSGALRLDGIFPRSPSQDTAGPMATTVEGLRLSFAALRGETAATSGADDAAAALGDVGATAAGDVGATAAGDADDAAAARGRDARPLRLGLVEGGIAIWGDDPHGPVLHRFRALVDALRARGVEVVPVTPPSRELLDSSLAIPAEAVAAVDAYLSRPGMPVRDFEDLLAAGQAGGMSEHALLTFTRHAAHPADAAELERVAVQREVLRTFTHDLMDAHGLDAVMYPSVQRTAMPVGVEQSGVFTRWSEHSGLPAVGLPMGPVTGTPGNDSALPCSAELLGRFGQDERLLEVAAAVEDVVAALVADAGTVVGNAAGQATGGAL